LNCAVNTPCENVTIKNIKIKAMAGTKKNVCINVIGANKMAQCQWQEGKR
jgi:hypothetical protein